MSDITFKQIWDTLTDVKVDHLVEEKMNLSYLSWSRAWFLLCELYPQAEYVYHDTIKQEDGTCSVGVTVKIGDCKRFASLPVMDYKMNAIVNPDARQINDGRQRCFVKAIAMFGLGIGLYMGVSDDLPDEEKDKASEKKKTKPKKAEVKKEPKEEPKEENDENHDKDWAKLFVKGMMDVADSKIISNKEELRDHYKANIKHIAILGEKFPDIKTELDDGYAGLADKLPSKEGE